MAGSFVLQDPERGYNKFLTTETGLADSFTDHELLNFATRRTHASLLQGPA